jgi:hypothetical protein
LKQVFSGIMLVLLCVGMLALEFRIQPVGADEIHLDLTMTVEKTDYSLGEPINVTLTVTNISNQTIDFLYGASSFDFLVYNNNGFVYQWSSFRIFPMFVVNRPLGPGENITNVLTWPQTCNVTESSQGFPVAPGAYYLLGEIPSYGLQTGPIEVNVDQLLSLVPLKTVVGQGYDLPLKVAIKNLDDTPEPFDVTLSTNATAIGTKTDINVSKGTSTLSFTWNTASFEPGHYNLNVVAGNLSAECSVVLTIPGDLNGDFKVDLKDLVILAQAYGSKLGNSNWNPNADIDSKGVVGLPDLVVLAQHYAQQRASTPLQVEGASVDLYDQYPAPYGGQGPNAHSDAFAPQDLVILYAKVTLGGDPITNALMSFEIDNPKGQSIAILQNYTDAEGVSTVAFRLPMTDAGWWKVIATTAVNQNVINDTMAFQ